MQMTIYNGMDKVIPYNPCDYIDLPLFKKFCLSSEFDTNKRVIKNDDCQILLENLKKWYQTQPEYIPLYCIELALLTGLRAGELAYLRWDHIDSVRKVIRIDGSQKWNPKTKTYYDSKTKTARIREIPLSDEIEEFLLVLKSIEMKCGYITEYVFSDKNGRIDRQILTNCARRKCAMSGLEAKGLNTLRRTYNSRLKEMGVSTTIAAALLGHSRMTNEKYYTYDTTTQEEKSEVVKNYTKAVVAI